MSIPYRREKLAAQIVREVSDIIRTEMKDPRLGFVTVTRAVVSSDFKHAKVFVSFLGDGRKRKLSLDALKHAEGFFQSQLKSRMKLRSPPEVCFVLDESLDKAFKVVETLGTLSREREAAGEEE